MDFSVLLAVASCLLVVYILKRLSSHRKLPPGPTGFPIVGYIPFLSRKPYLDFQELAKKYGDVFRVQMGSRDVVILNDYESTKEAFAQDVFIGRPKESPFENNKETIETEAFTGMPWKEQRRFSLHTLKNLGFGKSKMEGHIQEEINSLLERLEQNADKPYCIYPLIAPSMSNNIASLVFGRRFDLDDPVRQMLTRTLNETGSAAGQAVWQLFFPKLKKTLEFLGIGDVGKIARIQKEFRDYVKKEVHEHEKTLDPNNIRDFIDGYLLEIEKRPDDPAFCKPVLQDLVGGFFGAGSETVRLTVEWLLLTAATYQEAQHRVQQEIDSVVKEHPVWSDHKSMPHTEAFIMELMRWKTIIPINVTRCAIADVELGGYFIPKDTWIMANLWSIHHDPEYWGPDVEEFRPERFLNEDGKTVKKWERFIPFSTGKRQCPGEPFAKVEVFLYFTSILQRFHVKVPEGKVVDFEGHLGIGLMPKAQELIFTKRN